MTITAATIMSILGLVGSLIGVYVNLNLKIQANEKDIEHLETELSEIKENNKVILQIKDTLSDLRVSIAEIKKQLELQK
ncbi:hypothetical protein [Xanthocytophaga agilis]|uniref:Uncharacterized protein n=1 Tax=Xanthocytophaga agilis TaxID=3048010 RepID=A0AAE3UDS3_9BACT|nr:hypothetical protein [Xanthocytophaga agilis]MDJ1500641.1 hypothetical protein [Xanthocytophaga agilis]